MVVLKRWVIYTGRYYLQRTSLVFQIDNKSFMISNWSPEEGRQYNGQMKKDNKTNNAQQNTTQKNKDWATWTILVEQELFTILENLNSYPNVSCCFRVMHSVFLFIWPLYCLSFELRIRITPLASSNLSSVIMQYVNMLGFQFFEIK